MREISTVLLPGLDGTGLMLSEFAAALGAFTEVKIVRYPHFQPWDYDALLSFVRTQLPDTPHVVIGESFSGPLALRLAQEGQTELRGIILGASFARLDLPFKKAISCLTGIVSPRIVPTDILAPFLLGRWSTAVHRRRLRSTLTQVSPQVLSVRAKAALAVDQTTGGNIRLPVLYLRASEDRLIPKSATNVIAALAPRIEIREIAAPHFLFQAAPMECAAAVRTFYEAMAEG